MQSSSPHKSSLFVSATPQIVRGLGEIANEPGFLAVKELIDRFVSEQTDRLIRDQHMSPEDTKKLATEIRLYQGIADLPRFVRDKCVKEG